MSDLGEDTNDTDTMDGSGGAVGDQNENAEVLLNLLSQNKCLGSECLHIARNQSHNCEILCQSVQIFCYVSLSVSLPTIRFCHCGERLCKNYRRNLSMSRKTDDQMPLK